MHIDEIDEIDEWSVFLDTNILLYAFSTTRFSHSSETLLEKIQAEYNLIVLDTSNILKEALGISQNYGLLFSDALHAASAQKHQIDYFATNDRDFTRLDFLTLARPWICIHPPSGYYYASIPTLPGCFTQAKTYEELIERLNEAIFLYLSFNNQDSSRTIFS